MRDEREWKLALAEFESMHAHLPSSVSEKFVGDYHAVLSKLAAASGEDLAAFRVPAGELKPRVVSIQRRTVSRPGKVNYSKDNYCDHNFFSRKIDALARYIPTIESRILRSVAPDTPKDYWSMSTPELERLAAEFGIGGYGDQHGHVDRDVIIAGLLRRDSALRRTPVASMESGAAVAVLSQLIGAVARLRNEAFASPRRDEWVATAEGLLRRAFGEGAPIHESFRRAHSIMFTAGDTEENLRKAANETLAAEEAVLRSAMEQLGWEPWDIYPPTAETNAGRPTTGVSEPSAQEGPLRSINSTFDVSDGNLVTVDGEIWTDTEVDDESELRIGRFHGSSVGKAASLSLEDLGGYFDRVEISDPSAKLDLLDWEFNRIEIDLFSAAGGAVDVVYRIEYDLEFWARDYSIADLATATEQAVAKRGSQFAYWQRNRNTAIEGFGVSCSTPLKEFLRDVLARRKDLAHFAELIRAGLNEHESAAIRLVFDFPPAIKSACEQYLMYFVQFLGDLGIEAKAEVKERAHSVLFSVTPEDDRQALERIWEALQIYLGLPTAPDFAAAASQFKDIAVSQLQANVLHLQSQVVLAKAAMEMKNAVIEAKDEQLALLQERLDLRVFQPNASAAQASPDSEGLVGDLVAVKTWDYKFLQINFPELLRKLKRRFK